MAITSSTTFDKVRIACDCRNGSISTVHVRNDGDRVAASNSLEPWSTESADTAQLEIMREAVQDGTATVEYYDRHTRAVTQYDDLPLQHAIIHTLHQMHPDNRWRTIPALITKSNFIEDSDTGQAQIEFKGNINTPAFEPEGDTVTFGLEQWEAVPSTIDERRFAFQLDMSEELQVTTSNIDNVAAIRAMREYLEGLRSTSSAFGTSDFLSTATWTNRSIVLDNASTEGTDLTVTIVGLQADADPNGYYVRFSLIGRVGVNVDYDIDRIDRRLVSDTESISTTDLELESSLGNVQNPVRMSYADFGEGREMHYENGAPYLHIKDDDSSIRRRIYVGQKRIITKESLSTFGGNFLMPGPVQSPMVEEIHMTGLSEDETIEARTPPLMAGRVNNLRLLSIHNRDDTYNVTVEDWDGDNVITLTPGEHCHLRFSYMPDGTGGMLGEASPRTHIINAGQQGQGWENRRYLIGSDGIRPLPVPDDEDDFDYFDADTYLIGTDDIQYDSNNDPFAFNATNIYFSPQAFRVLKSGRLDLEISFEVTITSSAGALQAGWRTQLYRLRDGVLSLLDEDPRLNFTGNNQSRVLRNRYHGRNEAGDEYYPMMYLIAGNSLSMGDLRVDATHRSASLDIDISKTFTPST